MANINGIVEDDNITPRYSPSPTNNKNIDHIPNPNPPKMYQSNMLDPYLMHPFDNPSHAIST